MDCAFTGPGSRLPAANAVREEQRSDWASKVSRRLTPGDWLYCTKFILSSNNTAAVDLGAGLVERGHL